MPTTNLSLANEWTKIANAGDSTILITWADPVTMEIATTATDTQPDIRKGHMLPPGDAVTRPIIGPGYVWMRVAIGSYNNDATLVITK